MTAKLPALTALAALRAQPWAIQPEYLAAAEDLLARVAESSVLSALARDGHAERMEATLAAVAQLGSPLEGARRATIRNGVAVVPVLGVIAPRASSLSMSTPGTSLDSLVHDLRAAEASADVHAILMLVDSPGGQVSSLAEAGAVIAATRKPVTAFVQGDAASAAYWLASQAREIVADVTSALGSIGVVASLKRRVGPSPDGTMTYEIVSTGAPDKRADVSTEEGRASIQALIDAIETEFVGAVAAGRRVSAETVRRDFGRGGMLAARAAVSAGMADAIGTLDGTLARLAGAKKASTSTRLKGDRQMAENDHEDPATSAEANNSPAPPAPPALAAADLVAAERARIGAIMAATKPGFGKLGELAVGAGWTPELFASAQDACEPALQAARLGGFTASLPSAVNTAPAEPQPAAEKTPAEKLRAEYDADPNLAAEFRSFEAFEAYRAAEASGRLRRVARA
jgi:ClpP class serine protease